MAVNGTFRLLIPTQHVPDSACLFVFHKFAFPFAVLSIDWLPLSAKPPKPETSGSVGLSLSSAPSHLQSLSNDSLFVLLTH